MLLNCKQSSYLTGVLPYVSDREVGHKPLTFPGFLPCCFVMCAAWVRSDTSIKCVGALRSFLHPFPSFIMCSRYNQPFIGEQIPMSCRVCRCFYTTGYGACILHVVIEDMAQEPPTFWIHPSTPPLVTATGVSLAWYVVTHTHYVSKPQETAVSLNDHIRVTTRYSPSYVTKWLPPHTPPPSDLLSLFALLLSSV